MQDLQLSIESWSESQDPSQGGEAAAVVEVLRHLEESDSLPLVVEFGGHDGISNSNAYFCTAQGLCKALLIEPDPVRFAHLTKNLENQPGFIFHQDFVKFEPTSNLGQILEFTGLDGSLPEIISIDIDGDDVHVFASLEFRSKLVIVEYNPSIPWDVRYFNPAGELHGSSASALVSVATEKGYFLAAATDTNLLFIVNEWADRFVSHQLESLAPRIRLRRLAFSYDGEILSIDSLGVAHRQSAFAMPWGGLVVQPFPKFARKFEKRVIIRWFFSALTILTHPWSLPLILRRLIARNR